MQSAIVDPLKPSATASQGGGGLKTQRSERGNPLVIGTQGSGLRQASIQNTPLANNKSQIMDGGKINNALIGMMNSEKGGDIDFNFESRINRSLRSGGHGGTGGVGSHSANGGEDNNLLELMVMQNAADAIRQEYIEEPSYRKSMFNAPAEDIAVTRRSELPSTAAITMMVIAFAAFGFVTICFKAVYLNYRHTIWEDIYGRGIAFFICATIHYLSNSGT